MHAAFLQAKHIPPGAASRQPRIVSGFESAPLVAFPVSRRALLIYGAVTRAA
jgi:hypothetical protein